ncbi:hypothetical protein HanXRQr2_Chr15g0713801 [Helianthus annuus]|uniref:Uncharacterized protein n=1 Tax=Helianthus annuus TaxID=4232 RepID=A0A9K3E3Q2_HELAN|nr:hypothetical protein HanXRQr2_Chr15g0713801 [Helianthus annuus]KAJ0832983.1 hypothetical protein HanPSC8_Chr15g0685001 [Helianthus annuus]
MTLHFHLLGRPLSQIREDIELAKSLANRVVLGFPNEGPQTWGKIRTTFYEREMMHRIDQDTLRQTRALVTIKDARLVNYVMLLCC